MPSLTEDHTARIRRSEQRVILADGTVVPVSVWAPVARPAAKLLCLHGFGDYRRAFAEIGTLLARLGIAVYAYDQRGFGATETAGHWAGTSALAHDCQAMLAWVDSQPGERMFVLGESMGGAVALNALTSQAAATLVEGAILVEPALRKGLKIRYLSNLLAKTARRFFPRLPLPQRRGTSPMLTHNAKARLKRDGLVHRSVRAECYAGLAELADHAGEALADLRSPVLWVYGDGKTPVKRAVLKRCFHQLTGPKRRLTLDGLPHLLLHTEGRSQVLEEIIQWVLSPEPVPVPVRRSVR